MKYQDRQQEFIQQAENLVSQMTLEEAATQIFFDSAPIEHLHIPGYNWWNEALHGVARAGTATMFPQAIGLAAMFDKEEIGNMAGIIAEEGRAKYNEQSKSGDTDIYKGLSFWAPNINIFRDPRWGRGQETYGEDPYLTAQLGAAYVKALQGDGPYMKAAACAKHFAVHSGPEAVRHSFDAKVSQQDLWDTYLPAFEKLVCDAGVEAVMGAYNRTNGEPCCAQTALMQDILYGKWHFSGHFVSDAWALRDFYNGHHVTKDVWETAALALRKGCDLNCGDTYPHIMEAYEKGLVTEEEIRTAAVHVLTTRCKLGMFAKDCPYDEIPYEANDSKEHNEASLRMSRKSAVLLKNSGVLPLSFDKVKTIGVIGPNADSIEALRGNYYGTASCFETNLHGIRDFVGDKARVLYSEGCHLFKDRTSNLARPDDRMSEALTVAHHSDVVVLCLGLDATIEGEEGDTGNAFASGDKKTLKLPESQEKLLHAVCETGTPVILVLNCGSALDLRWADEHCAAILQVWYSGSHGGQALAELLFGESVPCGKLPVTFYANDDQLPEFEDYSMENRTYRYFRGTPLYPFGYGLSYTKFSYSGLKLSADSLHSGEGVDVQVTVTNTGSCAADEVTEVYVKDMEASTRVPNCSLCGFAHTHLEAGESKTLHISVQPEAFRLVKEDGSRVYEPGVFTLYAGGSQPDQRSEKLNGAAVLSAEVAMQ